MMAMERKQVFKFCLSLLFLGGFTLLFVPFYAEILLAAVCAFAMEPALGRWLQPRHLRWRTSVAIILIVMFFVIATPILIVCYKIYAAMVQVSKVGIQNTEIYQKFTEFKDHILGFVGRLAARVGLEDQMHLSALSEDNIGRIANTSLGVVTGLVSQIPIILLSIFVFCAALYFFLAEAAVLKKIFQRQNLLQHHEAERLIEVLQRASQSTVVASVVIGVLQASIVSLGALLTKSGDFTIVFVVTFFASFVPVIGAGPVALLLGAYQLLMGNVAPAIIMGIVAIVAGTTDNLVRPYLISSSEGDLHPIVSLLAIIGALVIFGMPGLLLGPVIASVAVKIIPTLYAPVTVDAKDLGQRAP